MFALKGIVRHVPESKSKTLIRASSIHAETEFYNLLLLEHFLNGFV